MPSSWASAVRDTIIDRQAIEMYLNIRCHLMAQRYFGHYELFSQKVSRYNDNGQEFEVTLISAYQNENSLKGIDQLFYLV